MRGACLAIALLGGCFSNPEQPSFVAPLDGQTGVPRGARLQIRTGWLGNPDGYPLPDDLVSVVDLSDGGFVPGRLVDDGLDILFVPDEAFKPDASYAWVVGEPVDRPRQPQLALSPGVVGESVFHTGPGPQLLDAVLDSGVLCLLLSEPVVELPWPELGEATVIDPRAEVPDLDLRDDDPGAGAACLEGSLGLEAGDVLRVGGVAVEVKPATLAEALTLRHRLEVLP